MQSSSSNLPLLPSERKIRAAQEEHTEHVVYSPTQVTHLELKPSDSDSVIDEAPIPMNSAIISPEVPTLEHWQKERQARDNEISRFAKVMPLPSSSTAEKLLHFMTSTTQFMNNFEVEVGERLDNCSNKINRLDLKVSLIESRHRLDPIKKQECLSLEAKP